MAGSGILRLLIEGWRNIPHSYALVNSFQILEFLKRDNIQIYFKEVPFPTERWVSMEGVFPLEEEEKLNNLPIWKGEEVDAVYRIGFPADLSEHSAHGLPVFVFLTAEFQRFMDNTFINGTEADIPNRPYLHFITPSKWSGSAFMDCERPCSVIPHGVDQSKFYPLSDKDRAVSRNELNFDGKFVWLNIGAMTGNKGIDILLQAFSTICSEDPDSLLLLKGLGDLYNSHHFLEQWLDLVPIDIRRTVRSKIFFSEASLPFDEVNKLYNVADVYVAPYRAEGFNLPILEAAACGLPSIISRSGSTEDFTNDSFVRTIVTNKINKIDKVYLSPELDDLIRVMREVRRDEAFRRKAQQAGPAHVNQHYQWSHAVDELISTIESVLKR